tara:strand:+ start:954 stop:1811 length:858 start_codon:yes stop_codon:yes gene_type:complete
MAKRNNLDKIGAEVDNSAPVSVSGDQLSFAVPTEFVELPSGGRYYPEGHPLHLQDTIEIKFMTAKEEDILNSPALLKQGVAIDRLLQSIILDKNVRVSDLLIGDKNALVIAARISGYGTDYSAKFSCPECNARETMEVDLEESKRFSGATKNAIEHLEEIEVSQDGFPLLTLPKSGHKVEMKFLTSKDETELEKAEKSREKHNLPPSSLTDLVKRMVRSVNGSREGGTISQFVDTMPAMDSKYVRGIYKLINPTMKLKHDFVCKSCNYDGTLEVPITPTFFWPDE